MNYCRHKKLTKSFTATFTLNSHVEYESLPPDHNGNINTGMIDNTDYDKQVFKLTKAQMQAILLDAVENDGDEEYWCEKCGQQ